MTTPVNNNCFGGAKRGAAVYSRRAVRSERTDGKLRCPLLRSGRGSHANSTPQAHHSESPVVERPVPSPHDGVPQTIGADLLYAGRLAG